MESILESIRKTNHSEWHTVKCIKELKIDRKTGTIIFKHGETYEASKINNNWWLIEQFGVSVEDFKKYFKDI